MKFLKFLLQRFISFLCVIFIGITAVFFIPRFLPSDPIESVISQMTVKQGSMDPVQMESIRAALSDSFGLEGSLLSQYGGFLKRAIFTHDFGPSFSNYPASVNEIIMRALPWTIGLLLTTTIITWVLGNLIGLVAAMKKDKMYAKIMESLAIALYPIPYYVFALALIMLFAYIIPAFPLSFVVRGQGWAYFKSIIYNSILPALSLVLVGFGWWVISMKTIASDIMEEDYTQFARWKGLSERKVMMNYVAPNATLPQITALAMRIGTIFNGAMVTEILFGYPGLGTLIQRAVLQADYNLIMGTISVSILAVALSTFVIDLIYPFIDPRIRYM